MSSVIRLVATVMAQQPVMAWAAAQGRRALHSVTECSAPIDFNRK
ncbi:hypothetical protein [Pseudomonas sp. SWRI77]|nr:hypothetical protein [Pseudomonas sp. SWRI77]